MSFRPAGALQAILMRIGSRIELNTLRVVGMYQQVDAFAFLAHDADADGHGLSIYQAPGHGLASVVDPARA